MQARAKTFAEASSPVRERSSRSRAHRTVPCLYDSTMPVPATGSVPVPRMQRIPQCLVDAIEHVLADEQEKDRLVRLAHHMKVEGQFRDAVFLALADADVPSQPEGYSEGRVARTDLVVSDPEGKEWSVEFKYWLGPDVHLDRGMYKDGKRSGGIRRSARRDWDKHVGAVVLVTVVTRVRHRSYFAGPTWDAVWEGGWDAAFGQELADAVDASESVVLGNDGFVVYLTA